ncbi:40S ribosomal protein S3 [Basidiobolus ranarum]|uniref:40S ribosomal protein S3 n=1 Tax=Basidiobolus ranarum TaxID=34480 RepID=A0ABR2VKK2_9FUNG
MLDWDPSGKIGPKNPLPDMITILEPKSESVVTEPISEDFAKKVEAPVVEETVESAEQSVEAK